MATNHTSILLVFTCSHPNRIKQKEKSAFPLSFHRYPSSKPVTLLPLQFANGILGERLGMDCSAGGGKFRRASVVGPTEFARGDVSLNLARRDIGVGMKLLDVAPEVPARAN